MQPKIPPFTAEYLRSIITYDSESGFICRNDYPPFRGAFVPKPNRDGRIHFTVQGKLYQAATLIWFYMTGEWPDCVVDHKDRDPSNNRWVNLREASLEQNATNRILPGTKPGRLGVFKRGNGWIARITSEGRIISTLQHKTPEEAAKTRDILASMYHGEFAILNKDIPATIPRPCQRVPHAH